LPKYQGSGHSTDLKEKSVAQEGHGPGKFLLNLKESKMFSKREVLGMIDLDHNRNLVGTPRPKQECLEDEARGCSASRTTTARNKAINRFKTTSIDCREKLKKAVWKSCRNLH